MTEAEWSSVTDPRVLLGFVFGKASKRKFQLFAVACCRAVDMLREAVVQHLDGPMQHEALCHYSVWRLSQALINLERYADSAMIADEMYYVRQGLQAAIYRLEQELGYGLIYRGEDDIPSYRTKPFSPEERFHLSALRHAMLRFGVAIVAIADDKVQGAARVATSHATLALTLLIGANSGAASGLPLERLVASNDTAWQSRGELDVFEEENAVTRFADFARDIFGNPFQPVQINSSWTTVPVTSLAETIYQERRFADLPILADALEEAGCSESAILDHCHGEGMHVRGCWVVDLVTGRE
jgi:hypothetical protein